MAGARLEERQARGRAWYTKYWKWSSVSGCEERMIWCRSVSMRSYTCSRTPHSLGCAHAPAQQDGRWARVPLSTSHSDTARLYQLIRPMAAQDTAQAERCGNELESARESSQPRCECTQSALT